jgi:hypothetical protein
MLLEGYNWNPSSIMKLPSITPLSINTHCITGMHPTTSRQLLTTYSCPKQQRDFGIVPVKLLDWEGCADSSPK